MWPFERLDPCWHCRYASYYGDYQVEPGLGSDVHDHAWNDEMYFASPHKGDRKFVSIDSHIMCTPVIGDIDADGRDELVVATTYFFDREYYDRPVSISHAPQVRKDLPFAPLNSIARLTLMWLKWTHLQEELLETHFLSNTLDVCPITSLASTTSCKRQKWWSLTHYGTVKRILEHVN